MPKKYMLIEVDAEEAEDVAETLLNMEIPILQVKDEDSYSFPTIYFP